MQRTRTLAYVVSILAALCFSASEASSSGDSNKDSAGSATKLKTVGKGKFKAPETVVWDERNDVYLVSNVNGKLTAEDDNGFISKVSPDGSIQELKWIDGASGPKVTLHAPKDMLLDDRHLIVADMGAVHYFNRDTGALEKSVVVPKSVMLNALAFGPDGKTLYVTDTGGKTSEKPGAIFEIRNGKATQLAKRPELKRPNGIVWKDAGLLVAPFDAHADEMYQVSSTGAMDSATRLPQSQLDGLLELSDGSLVVTSWKGELVYRVDGNKVEVLASGIRAPAQIGFDEKRNRLLVPSPKENEVSIYQLSEQQ